MLKKTQLVYLTLVLSSALAIVDFIVFKLSPEMMFDLHNYFALAVGVLLFIFSAQLILKRPKGTHIALLSLVIGLSMVGIHITKLILGICL